MRRVYASSLGALAAVLVLAALPAQAMPPKTFNPIVEAKNYSIGQERQRIYDTPRYQKRLAADSTAGFRQGVAIAAADPQRDFMGTLCWEHSNGCAGDIRLYNWAKHHYGIVRPVVFTARDGATLSGHVWATVGGPAHRPGIVITNGSVQADEQMYWFAAQTLAKAGYVVLTFDPQGQGISDVHGQAPDRNEGVPAQTDGRPFYDGTEDAIDFFLSTPRHRYKPVRSCSTGTSHAAKQKARVHKHLDSAYDPFWRLLNRSKIGLAGHSYGAAGVSYIGQWDHRVRAIVAWDNLEGPGPRDASFSGPGGNRSIGEAGCPAHPAARRAVRITKPALGISADYFLPPTPNTSLPKPESKSKWSLAYSKAGEDSGEIIIRGGTHLDFSWIPNQAFPASLRGPDLIDWYTTAWFNKYLKHARNADAELRTTRWRHDAAEAAVDPDHDGNAFSFYYYSRLDFHRRSGKRWKCEDLRDGCRGMVSRDGYRGTYSYIRIDTKRDARSGPGRRYVRGDSMASRLPPR
ncbi:MAG: alpha/beta hydrolase [Solirubrobacteraceae bacterium]